MHEVTRAIFGLSAACLAVLLSGCAGPPPPSKMHISEDPAILQKIQAASADVPGRTGHPDVQASQIFLLNNAPLAQPQMVSQLQAIVDRLLLNWTETPKPVVEIFILPDKSYSGDAAGTGQIFVNTGLLERADSEDEIAFVLAHELAHILRGHIKERQTAIAANNGMISFASQGAVYGIMLSHTGQQQLSRGSTGAVLTAFQLGEILLAANESVGDAGWSREQEYEADKLGLDLLIKSHAYTPAAFRPVFERVAAESKDVEQRRAELKGTITQSVILGAGYAFGNSNGSNTPLSSGDSAALVGSVLASPLAEKIVDSILPADTHPIALDRRDQLQIYATTLWPDIDPMDPKPNPFTAGAQAKQMRAVFDAVRTVDEINQAINDHKFQDARHLVSQPAFGRAMPLQQSLLRAKLAFAQGDTAASQRQLQAVIRDPVAPADAFTLLASVQASAGQTDAALATLDGGQTRFDSEAGFIPYRIAILRQAGRDKDVADTLKRCSTLNGGRVLLDSCQKAAQPPQPKPD
jgi:Zn-dependent protease with chaperone function